MINTERLFNAVLLSYSTEQLLLEDKLETIINDSIDIDSKIAEIKYLLDKLTRIEANILKFNNMVSNNKNNNTKQLITEENAKI